MPGMHYSQIIVGAGTSALTYLYCTMQSGQGLQAISGRTLVIGDTELWARNRPDHLMGQPQELLYPINAPRRADASLSALPQTLSPHLERQNPGTANYLKAGDYVHQLDRDQPGQRAGLKQDIARIGEDTGRPVDFQQGKVYKVTRPGGTFLVKARVGPDGTDTTFRGDRVIIASGPGPARTPSSARIAISEEDLQFLRQNPRSYPEIINGDDFYYQDHDFATGRGTTFRPGICIYGSSATSSWDVANALAHEAAWLCWVARSGFADANPVGRNSHLLLYAAEQDYLRLGTVRSIAVDRDAGPMEPRLIVTFGASEEAPKTASLDPSIDSPRLGVADRTGPKPITGIRGLADGETLVFHQFVYALGADPAEPGGPGAILDAGLKRELEPMVDSSRRIRGDDTVLALRNRDGRLLVVGAAVFRGLGLGGDLARRIAQGYTTIPNFFCKAARPPEGIVALKAGIKALTGYYEPYARDQFNWKTADAREMDRFFLDVYGEELLRTPVAGRQVGTRLVEATLAAQRESEFGLTKTQFSGVVLDTLRTAFPGRAASFTEEAYSPWTHRRGKKWKTVEAPRLKR
jgi:hypothetical protein